MITIILIVGILILAFLLGVVDGIAFPGGLQLALAVAQFLILLAILRKLGNENSAPGA